MAGHSQFKNIMHRKGRQDAARSKLFAKLAREITDRGQERLARPRHERAPAPRHPGGARREHAQGQHRARHQEGLRRRHRDLRDHPLRRLRTRRRRHHRRGPVQQPQPHRRCGARGVHASMAATSAPPAPSSHMFAHVGEIAYPASAALPTRCWKRRSRPAPTTCSPMPAATSSPAPSRDLGAVSAALEAKLGEPASVKALWRPMQTTAVDEEKAASILKLIAAPRGRRRRAERLLQLRGVRRRAGASDGCVIRKATGACDGAVGRFGKAPIAREIQPDDRVTCPKRGSR